MTWDGGDPIKGRILKGIGGFYYIYGEDGAVYECRAKGKFRREGVKPMPGDFAEFTPPMQGAGGSVDEIFPRKNQLPRPMIANLDRLIIVVAAGEPEADLQLVDKLLLYARAHGIPAAIAVNKADQRPDPSPILQEYAGSGAQLLEVSAREGRGLDAAKELLSGAFTCLAGQSAVGKSTLLNAIAPGLSLQTGELSRKTARGRHTTRHSELLLLPELDAIVADTPGFSILECMEMEPEELKDYYPEFFPFAGECRFDGCLHDREPQCRVKQAVAEGEVSAARYARYQKLLQELTERRENRYV